MNSDNEGNWRTQELSGSSALTDSQYISNKVKSTRYNLFTIIPKNLFEQFQRSANIWFLLISVFQLIPIDSNPVDSWTTVVPLFVLLFLTLLKDAYNDFYRSKEDKKTNLTEYTHWTGVKFDNIKCENLLVGSVVLVYEEQKFPADIVVLGTKNNRKFFLDTSGINGCSDLMPKIAVAETHGLIQSLEKEYVLGRMAGVISFVEPNNDFNKFRGKIKLSGHPRGIDLPKECLAYRGSVLKGAEWVIGIVVYTGLETKTYMNIGLTKRKISKLEKSVNKWTISLLGVLLIMVVFSMLSMSYLSVSNYSNSSYFSNFILFTILYNNIIPISLFVTMDMLRILQSFFIARRMNKMVDFNTGDVNENLGQIEYLFTDKTGAITENELKLKLCLVGDNKYFSEEDEETGPTVIDDEKPLFTKIATESKVYPKIDSSRTNLFSEKQFEPFSKIKQTLFKDESSKLYQYIKCMVVNNSVTCDGENNYIGMSRDEIAMVEACSEIGAKLCSRTPTSVQIEFLGQTETYEVLAVSPFSFSIFKVNILVKVQNEFLLYTNGNYENIKGIIQENSLDELESQNQFACQQGYRNIFMSYKKINESAAQEFVNKIENAKNIPVNSDLKIEILFKDLEKDSVFLGIAGIEDLVLPETVQTIELLQRSGIKICLLSGDSKLNTTTTAKKVGLIKEEYSQVELCRCQTENKCINTMIKIINQQFFKDSSLEKHSRNMSTKASSEKQAYLKENHSEESLHLNEKPETDPLFESKASENQAEVMLAQHPLFKTSVKPDYSLPDLLNKNFFPYSVRYSLVVDRQSFITATESEDARKLLCCLIFGAKSVVFFGLLPLDKAKIVNLVKENFSFRPVTLAIGEGNGDIPMIQAADVGVAVMNKAESQAKSYSDLAITSFSQLKYLLLLHGRWNYSRMSRSVLLFLYKNCLLTVITFAYVFVSDFSAESVFDSSLIAGFNLGFTSLPILALGVFDEDLEVSKVFEHPELYVQGQMSLLFNWKKMSYYLFLSVMDGVLISLVLGYNRFRVLNEKGFGEDFTVLGTSLYIILVLTVLIQISLDTYSYSLLYVCSQLVSLLVLAGYLWLISASSFNSAELLGTGSQILNTAVSFLAILIIPLVILALHQIYNLYSKVFRPNFFDKIASSGERTVTFYFSRLQTFVGGLTRLYRKTIFTKNNLEADAFELKKKSLQFYSEFIEAQYKEFYIYEYIKFYKSVIILIFILLVLWTVLSAFVFPSTMIYNVIRILMCAGFLVIVVLLWTDFFIKNYTILTVLIITAGLVVKFASEVAFSNPGAMATGLVPAITYILFNVDFKQITYLNIASLILYTTSLLIYNTFYLPFQSFLEKLLNVLAFLILNFSISVTSALLGYYLERTRRLEYKLMTVEKLDVERSQRILSFLLPAFVKKRVKDGARYIAEDQGTVTVFFCDIVDFDLICNEYEPKELTAFLDSVFQKFDQLCSAHGVTKIETVGKTYMACSGLKDSEAELDQAIKEIPHARRAVDLAIDIIALSSTVRLKSGAQLQVKIGINSGPVTAGVVGYHKPQFSLVGDTVNTSSRMCSTLEQPNSTQISKECYDLIEQYTGLDFQPNTIEAKGKGTMHTFIVKESKNTTQESGGKNGLGRYGTLLQNSSFNRTLTDGARIKKKNSELLSTLEINDGQLFNRSDTDILEKVKLIDFSCSETEKQKKFRTEKTINDQNLMFSGAAVALANFTLLLCISIVQYLVSTQTVIEIIIARSIIVAMLVFICGVHSKIFIKRHFTFIMLFVFLCMIAVVLLDIIYQTGRDGDLIALEVMYIILILNHTSQIPISKIIPAFLLIFIPWGVLGVFKSSNVSQHIANAIFVIIFAIINASALYTIETHLRAYFNLRGIAEKEISKTDKLLTQMMPPHVLENMRKDKATTDKFQDVTLLFADIVGFTAWSSNKTPIEVVGMLSEMFTRFDKKCLDHQVYKVHTIGDCYVVMGLTKDLDRNPAEECFNVVQMAHSMIQIIKDINLENGSELNMRIGIHIGEVIAGITGTNIVRYDIYGPDVMMANKMESGGLAGRICVSDAALELLQKFKPGMFEFEFNKEINAKAVNQKRSSYFIREVEGFEIKLDN